MRAPSRSVLVGLVALAAAAAFGSAAAQPWPWRPPGPSWGPGAGLLFGLAGAAIAADVAAESCWRWERVYDRHGHYVGHRRVDVCH